MEEPCGFANCLVRWITGVICLLQISLKLSFLQPARLAPHLAAGLRSWSALGPRCLPRAQHPPTGGMPWLWQAAGTWSPALSGPKELSPGAGSAPSALCCPSPLHALNFDFLSVQEEQARLRGAGELLNGLEGPQTSTLQAPAPLAPWDSSPQSSQRRRGGAAPWKLCCGLSLAHWRLGLGNLLAEEGAASTPPALWASTLPAETAPEKVAQHHCCHLSPGEGPNCSVKSALGEPESPGRT